MKDNLLALVLGGLLVFVVFGTTNTSNVPIGYSYNYGDDTEKVNESVEIFLPIIVKAFDKAEKEVLDFTPEPIDDGTDPDASKCICKGTGKIKQGDGHFTDCKYHGKDSSLESIKEEKPYESITEPNNDYVVVPKELPAKLPAVYPKEKPKKILDKVYERQERSRNTPRDISYQLVLFTASWCQPCEEMKREVIPLLQLYGFDVSNKITADFRVLDIDYNSELYKKYKKDTKSIPMIIEIRDNAIISREVGKKTIEELFKRYDLEKQI